MLFLSVNSTIYKRMYEKHLLEPLCKISKRDIQAHSKKLTDNAMTKKMKRPNDEQQHTQIKIEKKAE